MIEELAKQVLKTGSPEAQRAFREALRGVSDPAKLRPLAERFFADTEVSVPVFERLVELSPEDPAAHVDLGFVFFLLGKMSRRISNSRRPERLIQSTSRCSRYKRRWSTTRRRRSSSIAASFRRIQTTKWRAGSSASWV